jgi:ketosteroid isomerase-like protein
MRRILLVAAVLVMAAPATGRAADSDAEKEVAGLSAQYTDALVRADTALLDGILADDWMVIDPAGNVTTKHDAIKSVREGQTRFLSMDKSRVKVRCYGDAAVVTGLLHTRLKIGGQGFGGPVRFTEVYVSRAGRWRCVSIHLTRLPGKS